MALIRLPKPYASGSYSKAFLLIDSKKATNDILIQKVLSPNIENFGEDFFEDKGYRKNLFLSAEESFKTEKEIMTSLDHPNIIAYKNDLPSQFENYIMEFGEATLSDIVVNGQLVEDDIVKFIFDLSSAINYLHNKKIVHLDIAPRNIFFNSKEGSFKLGDFGMARRVEDISSENNFNSHFSPNSNDVPPEFIHSNSFSGSSDVFMLGYCILYIISKGQLGNYQKRFYEVLELLKYDIKKITNSLEIYNSNLDFYLTLLDKIFIKEPSKRIKISEIQNLLFDKFKNFKYENKLVGVEQQGTYNVLDYNFYGFANKVNIVFSKDLKQIIKEYNKINSLILNKFQNLFQNYKMTYYYFLKVIIVDHIKSPNAYPNENSQNTFSTILNKIINGFNPTHTNYILYFLLFELLEISNIKANSGRLTFFIEALTKTINSLAIENGFIILGENKFDAKKGEIVNSLIPIFNLPFQNLNLYYIDLKDYNNFSLNNSVLIEDIIIKERENYDIVLTKESELCESFVIIPDFLVKPKLHFKILSKTKLRISFITTFHDVINQYQKITFQVKLKSITQLLSTSFKQKVILQKSNNFCDIINTEIDPQDGHFISTDLFDKIYIL